MWPSGHVGSTPTFGTIHRLGAVGLIALIPHTFRMIVSGFLLVSSVERKRIWYTASGTTTALGLAEPMATDMRRVGGKGTVGSMRGIHSPIQYAFGTLVPLSKFRSLR